MSAIEREVAHQAARWFLRLQAADASEQERQACADWRAADTEHERAWQLATRFSAQVQAIPPAIGRATLQRPSTLNRRGALKALTSLVVLGSLGLTLSRTGTLDTLVADESTAVGEQRRITLADGSELHLDTDTAVDIRYSAGARTLVLRRGEVFVRTAADPRPFLLQTARGAFQPLGTRFAVRQQDEHDLLRVLEGAVMATPRDATQAELRVGAGEQALLTARQVSLLPQAVSRIDWIDGVLRVERMRLADFIAELGRYRHGWIRCAPEVAELRVSGAYQLADTDAALRALTLAFPVRVRQLTRYWVSLDAA
ncbi:FecR family protein [Pseudomonas sp. 148P]|uniref:FecR family protein n=1 Tax=Pseudomonas ulcerans TaxID=3115852 RepID=A0ABU7HSC8_9PSED|nr:MULTISPECIES: FecR family protein [unclassified Pseudomonas]MEE1925909.1 FecR family protein [Pseudomonas sp. 147P]MEE1934455.1 FecR family protein [Pseudomonas sp. 148P]